MSVLNGGQNSASGYQLMMLFQAAPKVASGFSSASGDSWCKPTFVQLPQQIQATHSAAGVYTTIQGQASDSISVCVCVFTKAV